ncbi:MAG TPA: hypothetical protein ENI23_16770 [bacterium]|nr:hypothetical protein [bacterium]
MLDPFEDHKQDIYQPPPVQDGFPDFNTRWAPEIDEGIKTKTGEGLDKGTDVLKKASNFYIYGLGLIALIIILPAILRFLYELSRWAYNWAGNIF